MIRVLAHMKDGRFVSGIRGGSEAESALEEWPEEFNAENFHDDYDVAWFDIQDPTPQELNWLGGKFHFHPLALEDCLHFDQRPKIEEYAGHLFVVIHGLKAGPRDGSGKFVDVFELHCFLAKNVVVTVHEGKIEAIRQFQERMKRDRNQMPLHEDFLLYRVLDSVVDANIPALDQVEMEIEALDEQVLAHARASHVERIHALQGQLNQARHVLAPQREIFNAIVNGSYAEVSEKAAVYFRDLYDQVVRGVALVEQLREELWAIRDVYLAVAAHRTNETMKRLTVFSVVFLPLTFITGFFGMNFEQIPWGSEALFLGIFGVVLLLPAAMLVWFNQKDWL